MIFDMVIYVTMANLAEMECILLLLLKSYLYISLFMCFKIFDFEQIKRIFVEMKTSNICFIVNVKVYR